jgi:hypothetical protein
MTTKIVRYTGLRNAVKALIIAEIYEEYKGSQPPEERENITKHVQKARAHYEKMMRIVECDHYINSLPEVKE